ncbi:AfsR/SARP family transcriptional regulator [Actinophytocola oryzae]|uniref:DNA-binding SARP family transcriptional activator n=1 Tax=Actinophytocola oryzae TaxID=502181 RepID=A0A4R7VJS2_9PSEU|nr:BTAD domain-containing putative transcriptional regulator [Actinophytocola oryzae]TDV49700.1 DNA-binding SARP family transcriptional activator [Actinophytocola oryzae]
MMEFRLLGDIEAYAEGRPVDIGYLQRRCILAMLLTEPNRVVPVERIVGRVWEDRRLPKNPRGAVQYNITMLRKVLARQVSIVWQDHGYRLAVRPETVDLHHFDQLVHRARTVDDDHAAALFEQALGLWRGQPFAGVDLCWFNEVRVTATRRRDAAWLDLIDVQLRRGRHTEMLAELSDCVERDPLDERLAAQYLVALYRCGRPGDALAHYQRLRQRLAEELGADPGTALQRVHQQILTTDPALAVPARVAPATRVPLPRQLPAPPRPFVGRSVELAHLDAALGEPDDTVPVSVICGAAGIGKTWLALHWAHRHLDRFPDGQLHVDLHGFGPGGNLVAPATALRGFLDALGVEPAAVPPETGAQIGLYRSLLAGRRVLVVLDNARATAQVAPLLPGSPTCAVLITSRHRLDDLTTAHGARSLRLDPLGDAEARELLARGIDRDRVTSEPGAVTELLTRCAGLPLAIGIVVARACRYPRFPLAVFAEELRDHNGRLDAWTTGDSRLDLRALLSWSHHALSPPAATALGLLGMAPGEDIGLAAAASLLALPTAQARLVLRELEDGHLLEQHVPSRYRMHDLVRLYALDRACHDQPEQSRGGALRRLVDHYVHTAFAGDRLLRPLLSPVELTPPAGGCLPHPPRDQRAALAWFTAELPNLLAVQHLAAEHGWPAAVHQLARLLTTFLYRQGRFHDVLTVWRAGLAATEQLAEPFLEAGAHQLLGAVLAELGEDRAALWHLGRAEALGDAAGQADTHHALGRFWSLRGDHRRALTHADRALRLYRTLGVQAGETRQLTVISWYHAQAGDHESAAAAGEVALASARRHEHREDEAIVLGLFGFLAQHAGRLVAAVEWYRQSHVLLHEVGSTYFEAGALDLLGQAHSALGRADLARPAWERALELCRAQHRAGDVERLQRRLDAIEPSTRTPTSAQSGTKDLPKRVLGCWSGGVAAPLNSSPLQEDVIS